MVCRYTPSNLTAEHGLTVAAAREALYRWLWSRPHRGREGQQGKPFVIPPGRHLWREELRWLGVEAKEAKEPEWLRRLPDILPSEPAPWGTGTAATSVAELRRLGVLPEALVNFLALLGWRPPEGTSESLSPDELQRVFHPEQIISTPVHFDAEKLRALNHHWLQQADLDRLLELSLAYFTAPGYLPEEPTEPVRQWLKAVIQSVLPGLDFLSLLPQRTRFIFRYSAEQALAFPDSRAALEREGARDVIREFGRRALADSWLTTERLAGILKEVRQATHRKGRAFLAPIRVMLTGLPFGPELAELVPILETGSQLPLPQPVKSCRQRVLEFCSVFV
ncbi:MAG: hypothetical protein HY653_05685 [Acidobacteria bacterium]|nr:hypothetical protein [Acidobacteriota bacterium]